MNATSEKVLLIILDGFGEGKDYPGNAITHAKTKTLDRIKKEYPHTLLKASGLAVGIPEGTQGGSEVGHFTMGAGRMIFQPLEEINESIQHGDFFEKKAIKDACEYIKKSQKSALHLIGMISDQGVHAHINHLFALLEFAKKENCFPIYIHAITDGRDVPERSAKKFLQQIEEKIHELGLDEKIAEGPQKGKIATIIGRYYAMDRDSNWNRTEKAYDLYTLGHGTHEKNPLEAIENAYARNIETDYYIDPIILDEHATIKDKDAVIFWNFRTDRMREITWCFTREGNVPLPQRVSPFIVCFGDYTEKAPVLFPTPIIKNNLGSIISQNRLKQFRIAETEKYAHVTYFFNSQVETPFASEERLLIDSPKCPSYAEKPEMSAREITNALLKKIDTTDYSLIVMNFANCDLVGHSGDFDATIKAVEVIDECLERIVTAVQKKNYHVIITGDHGNAEYMVYDEGEKKGEPCPSHTRNPVPFFLISEKFKNRKLAESGELENVAPSILDIMGIEKPEEMTGESLLIK